MPVAELRVFEYFTVKFRTEYICLKCHKIIDEERRSCPYCGGSMCARLIRVYS